MACGDNRRDEGIETSEEPEKVLKKVEDEGLTEVAGGRDDDSRHKPPRV